MFTKTELQFIKLMLNEATTKGLEYARLKISIADKIDTTLKKQETEGVDEDA